MENTVKNTNTPELEAGKRKHTFSVAELAVLGLLDYATDNQLADLATHPGFSDRLRRRICAVSARRAQSPAHLGEWEEKWDHHQLGHEFNEGRERMSPERWAWARNELSRGSRTNDGQGHAND